MNFKYCYKDEIHKSFKIPPTLEALIQDITASFKTKLPPNFNIRYKDMDGDFITISSDVEYHSMLKFDTPANTRTSFKLFIVSPRDNVTDEKEPSFEVIDSGNNTSQGGISEFSLTSKDCEEIPTERPSTSSQKDDNNTSTTERDRAPANSLQRSRVLNDTSDWKDEQLSFPDGEEESVSFGDETFNHAYKPVVSSPRQELVSPSLSGDSDMKVSLGREQQENSLEKIFDKMQPLDCRSIDFKEEEVNRPQSKENSVVLREIDNFMDKLVEQKKEMVPGSSDNTEIKPMFNAERIMPLDLFDRRRREKIMKIKNRSARIIQRAFRTHQLQKEFDKFRMEHRVSTQEAVVGLTNLIKARLQALIEAQLPIQPVHQTFEPTHITPQEVSFERRRMPWEPETTEPNCYSFEKSATEEQPHISRDCLICGDLRYCEHLTDNNDNNNNDDDDDEGYYRACSDNNLSLHDSRVESPYLDDLLNQSNSQVVEDTRLELPVIESKPVQSFGYRVMLGMSSSLLFLGGEEGQGVVYKTIYLENTGPKPWRKCYVKSVGLIEGKTLEFYNVDVGEISLVTLELNGYFTAGTYSSQWRLIHENEHGMMEPIGEMFEIEFMIESQNIINTLESLLPRKFTEEYPSQDFIYKYLAHDEEEDEATERYRDSFRDRAEDEQEPEEEREEMEEEQEDEYEDEEEDDEEYEEEEEEEEEQYEDEDEEEEYYDEEEEEEEEEEEYEDEEEEEYEEEEEEEEEEEYEERDEEREKEERFKKYIDYKDEIYKIREMRKIFPLESLDELIEFVDNRPQLTIEELLIGYLAMKNKY